MKRNEMIERISYSGNEACAAICKRIMLFETSIEHELKYTGRFMTHVLKGEFHAALECADAYNMIALTVPLEILKKAAVMFLSPEDLEQKAIEAQKEVCEIVADLYVKSAESPLWCLAIRDGLRSFKEIEVKTRERLEHLENLLKQAKDDRQNRD